MAVSYRNLGGTMNSTFIIGKGGPIVRSNAGVGVAGAKISLIGYKTTT